MEEFTNPDSANPDSANPDLHQPKPHGGRRAGQGVPWFPVAATSAGLVFVLCAVVAVAARRALVLTGNRRLHLVILAFALLAAKNLAKAVGLVVGGAEGEATELAFSLVDLAAVALIAWALVRPGLARARGDA